MAPWPLSRSDPTQSRGLKGESCKDQIGSLFWLIIAVVIMVSASQSSIGTLSHPESGFLPFFAGFILGVFSLVNLGLSFFSGPGKEEKKVVSAGVEPSWRNMVLALGALIAFPLLLDPLGFNITVFGFILFLTRLIGRGSWKGVLIFSFLTTAFCYLLFVRWLHFVVEKGIFGI